MNNEYEDYYWEMYPIHKCLSEEIESNFCGSAHSILVGKGDKVFVNNVWGNIVRTPDVSSVLVSYSLYSQKYKDDIKEKLDELYSGYQNVSIEEKKVRSTAIDFLTKSCELIVTIPCDANKIVYLKTDIATKQQLRVEAYQNIRTGLVVFNGENDQGFSMVKKGNAFHR